MPTSLSKTDQQSVATRLTLLIQSALLVGLGIFVWRSNWENVFLNVLVIALTLVPAMLAK